MRGLEGARSFVNLDPAPRPVVRDTGLVGGSRYIASLTKPPLGSRRANRQLAIRTVFEFSNGANGRRDWGAARAGDTGRLH